MRIIEELRSKARPTINILWPAFTKLKSKEEILQFFKEYVKSEEYPFDRKGYKENKPLPKSHYALSYLNQILHECTDNGIPYFPEEVRDRWDDALIIPTREKLGKSDIAERDKKLRDEQRTFNEYFRKWTRFLSLKPDRGTNSWSGKELGDLVNAQFQMRISDRGEWKIELDNPTHIIYFSQSPDGTYNLDTRSP